MKGRPKEDIAKLKKNSPVMLLKLKSRLRLRMAELRERRYFSDGSHLSKLHRCLLGDKAENNELETPAIDICFENNTNKVLHYIKKR